MITVAMSTAISASRDRVWRALTSPDELCRWDDRTDTLLDPGQDYPSVGRPVRWRGRMGPVTVILRDDPLEVIPGGRLRSKIATGLFRFDQTFTLNDDGGNGDRTRLTLKLVASNSLPVVGGMLDRFAVRRLATDLVNDRLRAVQKFCENHP